MNKPVVTKDQVLSNIDAVTQQALLGHFNTLYECEALGKHEWNIVYLAWLWANDYVFSDEDGMAWFDQDEVGMDIMDYELTFEVEDSGGLNLDVTHDFYELGKLAVIINAKEHNVKNG